MLEAFVYLFALYGLFCFFYFNLNFRHGFQLIQVISELPENQVCLVVKVRDAESTIEALVWEYVKLGQSLDLPHSLVVIDTGSNDQTVEILRRLTYRYPYLTLAYEEVTFGGRQVVVEYTSSENPKQTVELLEKSFKQEFST